MSSLTKCNKFGECRCPQCPKFYFDSNSCEIVWRCHGCGTAYDPYTTDPKGPHGYRFSLKRKSLLNPDDEFDYGLVKPRGRIPARNNTRYTLTATSDRCAVPRVYIVDSAPTCDCPRGCQGSGAGGPGVGDPFGIVEGVRSEATMMLWGFEERQQIIENGRGFVRERLRVSYDGVNASHAFPIKRGSLGKYYSYGNNTSFLHTECKFDYVLRFGTHRSYPEVIFGGSRYPRDVWYYDLGGIRTERWWDFGGPEEIYTVANYRLEFHTGWLVPWAPGTAQRQNDPHWVVELPSPFEPVMYGGDLHLRCVDYTPRIELPDWVSLFSGGYQVPRIDPYTGIPNWIYFVSAPGTQYYMEFPDGEYSPGIPIAGLPGLFSAPKSVITLRRVEGGLGFPAQTDNDLHWCNYGLEPNGAHSDVIEEAVPCKVTLNSITEYSIYGTPDWGQGNINWESLET